MAKGNILKEAIADAKAVREVALVNAKAALEEAFTPKLQNMLSARLSEDLDEDYYEDGDDELELGEMMYDEDMEEEPAGDEASMDGEIDLEEILNELELEDTDSEEDDLEERKFGPIKNKFDKDGDGIIDFMDPDGGTGSGGDYHEGKKDNIKKGLKKSMSNSTTGDDIMDESFDLDALLEEINSLDKKVLPKRISKRTPTVTPRNVRSRKPIGKLREGTCRDTKLQVQNLKNELFESNKALITIKDELNEVNLLNSKLLYVNRIFKQNSLDDPQKLRVVETLDKANSVKEAKLIYETIKDSFSISNEALEKEIQKEIRNTIKSKKSTKPIRENLGMASKATGMSRTKKVAPKRAVINESNNMISRFQKLANIKINE